jgi:hypothetical protein
VVQARAKNSAQDHLQAADIVQQTRVLLSTVKVLEAGACPNWHCKKHCQLALAVVLRQAV